MEKLRKSRPVQVAKLAITALSPDEQRAMIEQLTAGLNDMAVGAGNKRTRSAGAAEEPAEGNGTELEP